MSEQEFQGFPKACLKFYKDLEKNNNKAWFDANRDVFDNSVMAPAREFVAAMGIRLQEITPGIIADPHVNRSIFRINRDVRFAADKSPYKTFLGIWFWEGTGPKMECSGYYFQLGAEGLFLGVGMYVFPKTMLGAYRESVVDPKHGSTLAKAISQVTAKGKYELGGKQYKKVPRGYDPAHKNAELLLHGGLFTMFESGAASEVHSAKLVDYCFSKFRDMEPVHRWLAAMTKRAESAPKPYFV